MTRRKGDCDHGERRLKADSLPVGGNHDPTERGLRLQRVGVVRVLDSVPAETMTRRKGDCDPTPSRRCGGHSREAETMTRRKGDCDMFRAVGSMPSRCRRKP